MRLYKTIFNYQKYFSIVCLILAFAICSCRRNREEAPAPSSTPEVVPETVIEAEPDNLPEVEENKPVAAPKAGKTLSGSAKTSNVAPKPETEPVVVVESGNTEETSATEVDLAEQKPVNVVKDTCDVLVEKQDSKEKTATAAAPVTAATTTITADQTEPSVKKEEAFGLMFPWRPEMYFAITRHLTINSLSHIPKMDILSMARPWLSAIGFFLNLP